MSESGDQLEHILERINKKYISVPEDETKRNKRVLEEAIQVLIAEMKRQDALFAALFQRVFYDGSIYDGLRVGKPEEFDLDMLLSIPRRAGVSVSIGNTPGFVTCRVDKPAEVIGLKKFVDRHGNLKNPEVRQWMEGLTKRAMKALCSFGEFNIGFYRFQASFVKSGPARTLRLIGGNVFIDIDCVPCFVFAQDQWPAGGYRSNPIPGKTEFFIVPKMRKHEKAPADARFLWRLSFQEQERVLLHDKRTLKPALRLLKRLRDQQQDAPITSYYLETIFLWEVEQNGDELFLRASLSVVFLKMLERYIEWLDKGEIPYYWNKKNNLLGSYRRSTLNNVRDRLRDVHKEITTRDPFVVCQYLGTPIIGPETEQAGSDTESSWCSIM